jgi:hypothetical protein
MKTIKQLTLASLLMVMLFVTISIPLAAAAGPGPDVNLAEGNATTQVQVRVNFYIPSDTSFTVKLPGSYTSLDFRPTSKSAQDVSPDGQDTGVPAMNITNTGNTNSTYRIQFTSLPSWVVVKASADSNATWTTWATGNATTGVNITGLIGVDFTPGNNSKSVYMKADFTNAVSSHGANNSVFLNVSSFDVGT